MELKEISAILNGNLSLIQMVIFILGILIYSYYTGNNGLMKEISNKLDEFIQKNKEEHEEIKEWIKGEFKLRDSDDMIKKKLYTITLRGLKYLDGDLRQFADAKCRLIIDYTIQNLKIGFKAETYTDLTTILDLADKGYKGLCKTYLSETKCKVFYKRHDKRVELLREFIVDLCEDKVNDKNRRFVDFMVVFLQNTISDIYKLKEVKDE